MPRLIDADKLIEICDKGWRLGSAINTKIYHTVDASDIRSQPTVEAIPIEFIKQLIEEFDCERGNAIKDTFAHILTGLLEFWEFEQEKENEID